MQPAEIKKRIILNFWYFQIFGWIGFEILIHLQNLPKPFYGEYIRHFGLFKILLWWTCYDSVAFIITTGLRYLYRFMFSKKISLWYNLLVSLALSAAFSVVWSISGYFISKYFKIPYGEFTVGSIAVATSSLASILLGWSILYFGIKYWMQMQEEKEKAEKAEFMAQSAQLKMLRYQLNPHFLFNSLNSIWALIDEDRKASKEMVSELAEFLRYTLVSKDSIEVPLKQELDAIQHYLSIEKKRFEEKIDIKFDIDPKTENISVLSFILHPLVENALKYGLKTSALPLKIIISSKLENDLLSLSVTNSGRWIPPAENNNQDKTGTGIENIRLRLQQKFPKRFSLTSEENDGLISVKITINFSEPND
jgi:two-component system, LytTR family, sensor kinase